MIPLVFDLLKLRRRVYVLPCCHVSSQRYKSTENKDEMIEQMKKEMEEPNGTEEKESWNGKNSDTNEGVVNFEETCQPGPAQSKSKGVGKCFLVTSTYKKQPSNEISLTQGKFINMIMPASTKGMAFGKKKGRFEKKSKGFFPSSNTWLQLSEGQHRHVETMSEI